MWLSAFFSFIYLFIYFVLLYIICYHYFFIILFHFLFIGFLDTQHRVHVSCLGFFFYMCLQVLCYTTSHSVNLVVGGGYRKRRWQPWAAPPEPRLGQYLRVVAPVKVTLYTVVYFRPIDHRHHLWAATYTRPCNYPWTSFLMFGLLSIG